MSFCLRFTNPVRVERESVPVLKHGDGGLHFDDGPAHGGQAPPFVGVGENLALDESGVFAQGHELHRIAGALPVQSLFHNEAADGDFLAGLSSEVQLPPSICSKSCLCA